MGRLGDIAGRTVLLPLRTLWRTVPWWAKLLLILVPLAFVAPIGEFLVRLLELVLRVFEPLLHSTVGRVVLLFLLLGALTLIASLALRRRVVEWRAAGALGRHLVAVQSLLGDQPQAAADAFGRLARWRGPLPADYPHLVADANLKLARLLLAQGRVEPAMAALARVVERDLPAALRRSLLQLRVRALRQQGEVMPEALRSEVEAAVKEFPKDAALLMEQRAVLLAAGETDAAVDVQERLCKASSFAARSQQQQILVADLLAMAERALQRDDIDVARRSAKRLRQADPDGPAAGCVEGKVLRRQGRLADAIRAFGATRSPEGLELVAELLAEHPGVMEPRELLECCPMQGTLALVARELARQGRTEAATNAARLALERMGASPSVAAVLGEVLRMLGRDDEAARLQAQALLADAGRTPLRALASPRSSP